VAVRLVPDFQTELCKEQGTTYVSCIIRQRLERIVLPAQGWRGTIMPIRPFLAGQAFEPEVIRQMSLALESVCEKFGT